jgi:hypothetical protein
MKLIHNKMHIHTEKIIVTYSFNITFPGKLQLYDIGIANDKFKGKRYD